MLHHFPSLSVMFHHVPAFSVIFHHSPMKSCGISWFHPQVASSRDKLELQRRHQELRQELAQQRQQCQVAEDAPLSLKDLHGFTMIIPMLT